MNIHTVKHSASRPVGLGKVGLGKVGLSMIAALLLTACAADPLPEPGTFEAERLIRRLLAEAQLAFEARRLTSPRRSNALQRYRQVLSLDPGNTHARNGINIIVEQYLTWAILDAEEGNYSAAFSYIRHASAVDPEHLNIPAVRQKIERQRSNRERVFRLERHRLNERMVASDTLEAIVAEILKGGAFVVIRAPDDESGRWLYQRLNSMTSSRIEASLEVEPGLRPIVIVTRTDGERR